MVRCVRSCSCGCSQGTVMMNVAPIFLGSTLQLGTYANSAALRTALLQRCFSSRNFGASPTVPAGNGTGADDDNRMQVDCLKKGTEKGKTKHQNQKGTRSSNSSKTNNRDINTCKNCGRTGHWVKEIAGDQVEEHTTTATVTTALQTKAITIRRAMQRQTGGRGGNEFVFRHSLNPVVSFTDTEHDHGSDNQVPV